MNGVGVRAAEAVVKDLVELDEVGAWQGGVLQHNSVIRSVPTDRPFVSPTGA